MAFEPLETDEKVDNPQKKGPDMDTVMLFGCSGFVVTSIGGYILSVWPFLLFQDSERITTLGTSCAFGLLPAAILGMVSSRKFGLAGACGFVGGSMATGIFMFLRIQQAFVAAFARQAPPPDYPQILMYLVPLSWVIVSLVLALLLVPNEKAEP